MIRLSEKDWLSEPQTLCASIKINQFAWSQALVILIAILVIVIISEALSAYVRSRIV